MRAVACIVFVGTEAVRAGQSLLGDADPLKAAPGSLRAELCLDARFNGWHASASAEAAERDIALWFDSGELLPVAVGAHT